MKLHWDAIKISDFTVV